MHAVVIDDDSDIRTITRISLETTGYSEVTDFSNGVEAVEFLKDNVPDVILLDYMMPDHDGPEVLKMIKALPSCAAVPVIFLTALASEDEIDPGSHQGLSGFIGKPYDPMTLADQIKEIIAS